MIKQSTILDGDQVLIEEVLSNMAAIGYYSSKSLLEPDNAMVRHQFVEVIVRIAMDKYMKNKIGAKMISSVQKVFTHDFAKILKAHNLQEWREKYLWNQKCDIIFKSYMPILKDCFKKYCYYSDSSHGDLEKDPRKEINIEERFMLLQGFRAFGKDLDLESEGLTDTDLNMAFNYSMMLQIDEVTQDKHLKMNLSEFIEAFARIADIVSLQPYTPQVKNL